MGAELLIFWGQAMRRTAGIIRNPKKRGEWVELKFMVKAAEYGLGARNPREIRRGTILGWKAEAGWCGCR